MLGIITGFTHQPAGVIMNNTKKKIYEYSKELHLTGIREYWEELIRIGTKESMGYEEFLLCLLERERTLRNNRRIERLLKESRLPLEKSMDNFDLKRLPMKVSQLTKTLLDGSFLNRRENILAFGNPGSGKTHLLCGIGQEIIRRFGRRILYVMCSDLVQELLAAKKVFELPKKLKKLSKYDAIIIDDIGYVKHAQEEMEVLFTLLAHRYERGSVIITSNLPFSKWETIFKDPVVTAAAIDRLIHHCVILELNVESYRMEEALKGTLPRRLAGKSNRKKDAKTERR
jgi:DNA replication protein DnaC